MKICISSTGPDKSSEVDPRFGRCQYFLIVDSDSEEFEAVPNQGVQQGSGAGVSAAQLVADKKVSAIITGNIGPNAFMVLSQLGIKIYTGVADLTCQDALNKFKNKKLVETKGATGSGRHGAGSSQSNPGRHGFGFH